MKVQRSMNRSFQQGVFVSTFWTTALILSVANFKLSCGFLIKPPEISNHSPSLSSFPSQIQSRPSSSHHERRRVGGVGPLASILDDMNDPNKGDGTTSVDFKNFNPLSYKASSSQSSRSEYTTQISLRKTMMQELTSSLLNLVGDTQATQQILEEYRDFLLEPLEDPQAVLENDSIYSPQMSRSERYQAYRSSMEERLSQARSSQVKRILQSMKDFVLSHEKREEE